MIFKTLLFNSLLLISFIKKLALILSIKLSFFSILALSVSPVFNNTGTAAFSKNSFKEKPAINTLFVVRHNKSPNYVVYQANIEANKKLNIKNPVDVYWFMKTKGETIEKVTIIEWKLAYGFELDEVKRSEEYKLNLHAIEEKTILVKKNSVGKFTSYMTINGEKAKLKVVFINFETTFGFPSVKYLDFRGTNIHTGKFVTERFFPE